MKTINTILTIFFTFIGTINALACSCQDELPVSASVKHADVVFSGQVISKTLTRNFDSLEIVVSGDTSKVHFDWRGLPIAVVKIKVEKIYKGRQMVDTLTILTASTGAMCGILFEPGEKCIVYATTFDEILGSFKLKRRSLNKAAFWTHLCTRTRGWDRNEEREIMREMKS